MSRWFAFASLIAAAIAPLPALAAVCPGTETNDARAADYFYAQRGVTIIRAAKAGDMATLETLVAPRARFDGFPGDPVQWGPLGAIEMAKGAVGTDALFYTNPSSPIDMPSHMCEWQVALDYRLAPNKMFKMDLWFRDGLLVKARSWWLEVSHGIL